MFALFTDYGIEGPYVGQVHARIAADLPGATVIDLFHAAPAFDIRAAAYLLPAYTAGLPADSVCICVVDPGVGGTRGGLIVRTREHWYVGPDNGLLAILLRRDPSASCRRLEWRPADLSPSFHGRDWFAPAAVRLRLGRLPPGEPCAPEVPCHDWPDDWARILYIDRFGNAVTGLRAAVVADDTGLQVGGLTLPRARVFSDVGPGTPFWYANANGLVEIAVNQGRADRLPGVEPGAEVTVVTAAERRSAAGRQESWRHA